MSSDISLGGLQRRALGLARELARRRGRDRLSAYRPYAKQREFHDAGAEHRERLFMAGNQLGKTVAGSFEIAMHLTGRYPGWWRGRRFDAPGRYWVAGETRISTRDTVQKLLLGDPERPEAWGTGAIPGAAIRTTHRASGVANAIDTLTVAHVAGGASTLLFKAYEQGRAKWQGDTLNGIWFDEEPPLDIYVEGLTRTNATGGFAMLTFTPLKGMSEVVRMFLEEA
ncbi:Bacteriophage terminase large (ATPase) subunit and inactivated derivatives-like protein [Rhizorhabdus wittichii RW1]|uniref:Bacteriophage terminase large (ATPase) subunit and inactivated derivatives-like protein n=1 Tax=Rhizorhabdus wittichii (strain DSM 6014 / CCUG 31198 / JCM 15750 / NBRC 105917 / EY 4224 / RW1) TaxID=392499 RepID=A0A9J9LFR1_RHIWR|nr:Bacteriophage terminase large (ATPase) subunit and inactivated derivatives-like protein [Rhizorhabdus wittichii RW1]